MEYKNCILRLALTLVWAGLCALGAVARPVTVMDSGPEGAALPGSDSAVLPSYVKLVGDSVTRADVLVSDSVFYNISRGVVFPVNRYELNRHDPLIVELRDSVLPMARMRNWALAGIELRGAASPEGPYRWNVELSHRRAKALTEFLTAELGQGVAELMTTQTTAEDYVYLLMNMDKAGDADAEKVRALMTKHGDNVQALKTALQKVDGGKLWKRLLAEYYPELRAARLVLFFRERQEAKMVSVKTVEPLQPERVDGWTMPEELVAKDATDRVEDEERRHVLSVSTNLLYDAFWMPNYGWAPAPNVELEYYPRERAHWTYLAAFTSPYYHRWSRHKFFQLRDYHIEARRYFNPGRSHTGAFAAAYVNNNIYGIGLSKTKGWEGEGAGAALKGGYVWRLSRSGRWRIEAAVAVGGYQTRFDPYVYGNPVSGAEDGDYYYDYTGAASDFKKRNHQRVWFGPTEIGIKIRYDLLYKRVQRRGVSFKRKEVWR